jgi:macrodomain Ter protein organizer (MatP/YcbG family)
MDPLAELTPNYVDNSGAQNTVKLLSMNQLISKVTDQCVTAVNVNKSRRKKEPANAPTKWHGNHHHRDTSKRSSPGNAI